jgi:aspartate racemase
MTARTIGILAGMGPRSTGPFLNLVADACQEIYGAVHDIEYPPMLICSQPAPFYEDRPIDHEALEAATVEGLLRLQEANVDVIAMACNTVHIYYDSLTSRLSVPLLNIVQLAVNHLGPNSSVAIVASRATYESGIYQMELRRQGHSFVTTDWQSTVDEMLTAIRTNEGPQYYRAAWQRLADRATEAKVDAVLVACLDLSSVFQLAPRSIHFVDAAKCLAEELVHRWREASS